MCQIQSGYFTKDHSVIYIPSCNVYGNDVINAEAIVIFSGAEIGQQYKCELKISAPNIPIFSLYTPLRTVSSVETFTSDDFPRPVPFGVYTVVYVVIYNSAGNTICTFTPSSEGTGSPCNTLHVYISCTTPSCGFNLS